MEDIILGGAKESNQEYDFSIAGGLATLPRPLFRFEERKIQYNQAKDDPWGCTWYAVMTAVANNWWIDWTDEDFEILRQRAPSYGRAPREGMLLSKAGDMVMDYLNQKFPGEYWTKKSLNLYEEGEAYCNRGYILQVGSLINKKYISYSETGLITDVWGKNVAEDVGHARSFFIHTAYVAKAEIENYYGVFDHNVMDIDTATDVWLKMEQIRQYYTQAFIYYPSGKMPTPIPHPYMTVDQAEALEKKYPELFTSTFSESVRAWIEKAQTGLYVFGFTKYEGVDGVTKMMIDLDKWRT